MNVFFIMNIAAAIIATLKCPTRGSRIPESFFLQHVDGRVLAGGHHLAQALALLQRKYSLQRELLFTFILKSQTTMTAPQQF